MWAFQRFGSLEIAGHIHCKPLISFRLYLGYAGHYALDNIEYFSVLVGDPGITDWPV